MSRTRETNGVQLSERSSTNSSSNNNINQSLQQPSAERQDQGTSSSTLENRNVLLAKIQQLEQTQKLLGEGAGTVLAANIEATLGELHEKL
eukprot:1633511-Amphidinium_carterae.1